MGVAERVGDFEGDLKRVVDRELPLPVQPIPKGLALHERHHVEQQPVSLARIVETKDVRVLELGRELDLAPESSAADRRAELRVEPLDGDFPLVLDVVAEIDGGHPAPTELPLDLVTVTQGYLDAIEGVGGHSYSVRGT